MGISKNLTTFAVWFRMKISWQTRYTGNACWSAFVQTWQNSTITSEWQGCCCGASTTCTSASTSIHQTTDQRRDRTTEDITLRLCPRMVVRKVQLEILLRKQFVSRPLTTFWRCKDRHNYWNFQILEQRNQKKLHFLWWVATKFSNKLNFRPSFFSHYTFYAKSPAFVSETFCRIMGSVLLIFFQIKWNANETGNKA